MKAQLNRIQNFQNNYNYYRFPYNPLNSLPVELRKKSEETKINDFSTLLLSIHLYSSLCNMVCGVSLQLNMYITCSFQMKGEEPQEVSPVCGSPEYAQIWYILYRHICPQTPKYSFFSVTLFVSCHKYVFICRNCLHGSIKYKNSLILSKQLKGIFQIEVSKK